MAKPMKVYSGQQHYDWTIIKELDELAHNGSRVVLARCVCGNERKIPITRLFSTTKPNKSCGCSKALKIEAGTKFGRLTVIGEGERKKGQTRRILCVCDCGAEVNVELMNLTNGRSKSCGNHRDELKTHLTHGMTGTVEHSTWFAIKSRCYNKNNPKYPSYGARGIKVCDRWLESFENFYADMGKRPSTKHSIDRIDNDGDYCPENCRWATLKQQANNKRNINKYEFLNTKKTISEWADIVFDSHESLYKKMVRHGFDLDFVFKKYYDPLQIQGNLIKKLFGLPPLTNKIHGISHQLG